MDSIRFQFKDLHEGDEVIVTDFLSTCDNYRVISIGKGEPMAGWHFVLENRTGITAKYVAFWATDLEYTHQYLDDGRVVYVNAIDFIEDCDTRRDRIRELKDNFIKNQCE